MRRRVDCHRAPVSHHAWLGMCLLASLAATWSLPSRAQTSAFAAPRVLEHRVVAGDTLEQLARRYLGDAQRWTDLQNHNRVPSPYRLQPGSVLEIPLHLLRMASASVDYVQGSAQVQRAGTTAPVARGASLQEGDRLQLDPDAFVSVRLADGSTVRVQAGSQLSLSQLRRRGRAGSLQSVVEVEQGGVDIRVPGGADAQRRLDVITPVAATSVRGTQFDVQLGADGSATTAVLQGRVGVQSLNDVQRQQTGMTLPRHMGVAVDAQGQASAARALLPAVDAQQLPRLNEDAQWLNLPLPAAPEVHAWRVAVTADAQGDQVLRNGMFTAPLARFAAIADGNYYLHVRPVDDLGISGLPTTAPLRVKAHPVPPLLQVPAPDAVLPLGQAQLQCTPVEGVHTYRHQIVTLASAEATPAAADFAQPGWQHASTTTCQMDLGQLPAGSYAWRAASVRTVDGVEDQGPFAVAQRFRIEPPPPTPSLDDLKVQTVAGVSSIHWPGEPGQRFRLQAFDQPDGTTPALDTLLDAPQWQAAGLPAGTWHVRIQVQDPNGLTSAFSPPRSVRILPLVRDGSGAPVQSGTGLGVEHP